MRADAWLLSPLRRLAMRVYCTRRADRCIGSPGDIYLRRWYLWPRNRLINLYLHVYRRSDDARALHDHPWWSLSICLFGQYDELIGYRGNRAEVAETRFRTAGDVVLRSARHSHRIAVDGRLADQVWTLFLTGPVIRTWGFHCPGGRWVRWQDFTAWPHA